MLIRVKFMIQHSRRWMPLGMLVETSYSKTKFLKLKAHRMPEAAQPQGCEIALHPKAKRKSLNRRLTLTKIFSKMRSKITMMMESLVILLKSRGANRLRVSRQCGHRQKQMMSTPKC